jgi:galactonate dehydratase
VKITAVRSFVVQGPWCDLCLVKVETDEGLVGWGEGTLAGRSSAVAAAVSENEQLVLGLDPLATEQVWQRLYRHVYWRGGPIQTSSISAIDIALWDIRGKAAGLPVFRLLGGPVRERVEMYANIGLSNDDGQLREWTAAAQAMGYRSVKFLPLMEDGDNENPRAARIAARTCAAVRDAVGEDGRLMLDFHGRLDVALAIAVEDAVRESDPFWIEEPLPAENLAAYERLARRFRTPLALGERQFTRWGYRELFERQIANFIQPDVANAGGISEVAKIAAMAEMHGVRYAPHNPNGPVQSMASLHLAAAMPAFSILEHDYDSVAFCRDIASASPEVGPDGHAALPERPGLGIEIDEAALPGARPTPFFLDRRRADGAFQDW